MDARREDDAARDDVRERGERRCGDNRERVLMERWAGVSNVTRGVDDARADRLGGER